MSSRLGCNLVDQDNDGIDGFYTRNAYETLLQNYAQYLDVIGYLEFSHVTDITPDEAAQLGTLARAIGFIPWSIHSEHLNEGDTLSDYLAIQKHEAEVCAALGCQVMVCHLPNLSPHDDVRRDVEVIGKVAELTHANGVRLAVETCFYPSPSGNIVPDAKLVMEVIRDLNRSDVGINVDTGHCLLGQTGCRQDRLDTILSGEIPQHLPDLVKQVGTKLFTTHLQDNFGLNDDHQAPGMGFLDWETLIPAILQTGYQGPLMMELTGPTVKIRRTVPQLKHFPLKKELIFGASYLQFILHQYENGSLYRHAADVPMS